jgi:hypothetical protein
LFVFLLAVATTSLGGRVKPGHDELRRGALNPTAVGRVRDDGCFFSADLRWTEADLADYIRCYRHTGLIELNNDDRA